MLVSSLRRLSAARHGRAKRALRMRHGGAAGAGNGAIA